MGPPPRARRRRRDAARAPAHRPQRPGAERLAAAARELAASAGNALGHAIEGAVTALATPVPTLAARDAARRLALALPPARRARPRRACARRAAVGLRDRRELVRPAPRDEPDARARGGRRPRPGERGDAAGDERARCGARLPDGVAAIDAVVGEPVEDVARRFAELAGASRLRDIGVAEDALSACAQAAAGRVRAGADAARLPAPRSSRSSTAQPGERRPRTSSRAW